MTRSRPLKRIVSGGDPAVAAEVAHDGQRHGGLAAAELADEAEGLAGGDGGGEVHHRGDLVVAAL